MCNPKAIFTNWKFGVVFVTIGVMFIIGGILDYYTITEAIDLGIRESLVVDSKKDPDYDNWADNMNDKEASPLYQYWWFFNITNPDQVLAGGAPNFDLVGPYTYRDHIRKVDVEFHDNGKKETHIDWESYLWEPKESFDGADPDNDMITGINYLYMAAIAGAGSEYALNIAICSATLQEFISSLTGDFVEVVKSQTANLVLFQIWNATTNGGETNANHQFLATWANATQAPNGYPDDMLLSPYAGGAASGISLASAEAMWDPLNPLSLNNPAADAQGFIVWLYASVELAAGTPSNYSDILMSIFGLSVDQLGVVVSWWAVFKENQVVPVLKQQFGVAEVTDIGWLQWGTGMVFPPGVQYLDPSNPLPGIVEYGVYGAGGAGQVLNVSQSKSVLNGTNGMFDAEQLGTFLVLAQSGDFTSISALWGLNSTQAIQMAGYLVQVIDTFVNLTVRATFADAAYPSGVLTTRSATNWLYEGRDALLILLGVNMSNPVSLNYTTKSDLRKYQKPSTRYTGKGDIDDVAVLTNFQGISRVPWWPVEYYVDATDGKQFNPFQNDQKHQYSWSKEIMRNCRWDLYKDDTDIRGIPTKLYRFSDVVLEPNPDFDTGLYAIINITGPAFGAPLYISKHLLLDAEAKWREKYTGVPEPNREDNDLFIWVDPRTGLVLKGYKRMQLNVYIPQDAVWFDYYFPTMVRDIVFPIAMGTETGEMNNHEADLYKSAINDAYAARTGLTTVFVLIGSCLFILGVVVIFLGFKYGEKHQSM